MDKSQLLVIFLALLIIALVFTAGQAGYWLFVVLMGCCICGSIYSIVRLIVRYVSKKEKTSKDFTVSLIARVMGLFFFSGTLLTFLAFPLIASDEGVRFSNVEMVFRSMLYSIDLFILDVESSIIDRLDHHATMKVLLVVQAFASFICTISMILNMVYSRLRAYIQLNFKKHINPSHNHLYIFFDSGNRSKNLVADIMKKDKKAIVIFIETTGKGEDDSDIWGSLIGLFVHNRNTFETAKDTGALIGMASRNLSELQVSKLKDANPDVWSMIGLTAIKQMLEELMKIGGELHVFFLSDEEERNVRDLLALSKDATLLQVANSANVKNRIYCHARYNGYNRAIEDLAIKKNLNVEIIDSLRLAVELLKFSPHNHPVRFIPLSKKNPTTVEKPLDALIVGFDMIGQEAFKFIYEFGVFLGEESTPAKTVALKPKITAVDKNMNELKGEFISNFPAIDFEDGNIKMIDIDPDEEGFYSKILSPEKSRELNYIIVALDDDERNILIATKIFNYIRQHREDLSHLVILVRNFKEENVEIMQKVADHYNYGYERTTENLPVIRLFAKLEDIYNYEIIVREDLLKKGQLFLDHYLKLKGEGVDWKTRRRKLIGKGMQKDGSHEMPKIDNLRKLRRQESQDLANALHAYTKLWLLKSMMEKGFDWNEFSARFFGNGNTSTMKGEKGSIHYPGLNKAENEIILNLAILEHLRWNASHELMGYSVNNEGPVCDERKRMHNCLRPWEELDAESEKASSPDWKCDYKSYDFCVVETSVAIGGNKDSETFI